MSNRASVRASEAGNGRVIYMLQLAPQSVTGLRLHTGRVFQSIIATREEIHQMKGWCELHKNRGAEPCKKRRRM